MEIVVDPSRGDYGKEMFTVVPLSDITLATNNANAVFHFLGTTSRQRLAGYERLAGSSSRTRGK